MNDESRKRKRFYYSYQEIVSCLKSPISRKCISMMFIMSVIIIILALIILTVIIPLIFMNSKSVRDLVIFNYRFLPKELSYFDRKLLAKRNIYVTLPNNITLGVWHLAPYYLAPEIENKTLTFEESLLKESQVIVLYFHGTGEARNYQYPKFQRFRIFAHVFSFDYRNFGDSSNSDHFNSSILINDSVEIYKWILNQTNADIIIWGQSLGASIATGCVAKIFEHSIKPPIGLVIESGFTNFREEFYNNRLSKLFSWLPWFESTVIKPIEQDGYSFNSSKYILNVKCPIMFLCSNTDKVVPNILTKKLHSIAKEAHPDIPHFFHEFIGDYGHFTLYKDIGFVPAIRDFIESINKTNLPEDIWNDYNKTLNFLDKLDPY